MIEEIRELTLKSIEYACSRCVNEPQFLCFFVVDDIHNMQRALEKTVFYIDFYNKGYWHSYEYLSQKINSYFSEGKINRAVINTFDNGSRIEFYTTKDFLNNKKSDKETINLLLAEDMIILNKYEDVTCEIKENELKNFLGIGDI